MVRSGRTTVTAVGGVACARVAPGKSDGVSPTLAARRDGAAEVGRGVADLGREVRRGHVLRLRDGAGVLRVGRDGERGGGAGDRRGHRGQDGGGVGTATDTAAAGPHRKPLLGGGGTGREAPSRTAVARR